MNDPLSPSYHCILEIGVGLQGRRMPHHTVEFSVAGKLGDDEALANALHEVANALVAPTVSDPELL